MAETLEIRFTGADTVRDGATAPAPRPGTVPAAPTVSETPGSDRERPRREDFHHLAESFRKAAEDLSSGRSVDRPGRATATPRRRDAVRREDERDGDSRSLGADVAERLPDLRGTAGRAGSFAADRARGAADRLSGGAASRVGRLAGRLGPRAAGVAGVGIAAVGAAAAVAALGFAAVKASQAFSALGDDIEDLSGPVAAVRARLEVEQELARVQRARLLGERVARVNAAQGRLALAVEDFKTSVLDTLADLAPLLEGVLDAATSGVRGVQALKEGIDVLLSPLDKEERKEFQEAAAEFREALAKVFQNDEIRAQPIDADIAALLGLPTGDDGEKPDANPGLVP